MPSTDEGAEVFRNQLEPLAMGAVFTQSLAAVIHCQPNAAHGQRRSLVLMTARLDPNDTEAVLHLVVTRSTRPASTLPIGWFLFRLHFCDIPSFTPSLIAF